MPEQLLKGAQVRPAREEVRCETVPQSMRRKAFRQAKPLARGRDRPPNQVGVQRPSPSPHEKRPVAVDRPRTLARVIFDRFPDGGHDRNDARFRPLAGDPKRLANRPSTTGQRQRLGNAKASAVEKQEDGEVASADPILRSCPRRILGQRHSLVGRDRTRKRPWTAWSPGARQLRNLPLLLGREGQEISNGGKLARRGGRPKSLAPPFGEEGTKILSAQRQQQAITHCLATIITQEFDQAMRRRDIGAHGVRGAPAVMEEMARPALDESAGGMIDQFSGSTSHRRMIAARLRPRNISNSEP